MSDTSRMPLDTSTAKYGDGQKLSIELSDPQGALLVSQRHGSMQEAAQRGAMFHSASQAATTSTIALATTYTGLCLSNPAGNSKNLVPRQVGVGLSVAPAAEATIALAGGFLAAGITTHTTPETTYNNLIGNATAATGLVDAAATLVGTPELIMPLMGAFTAAALHGTSPVTVDLDGSIVIPPGGYVFIYTLTVVVGFFGIIWEEVANS